MAQLDWVCSEKEDRLRDENERDRQAKLFEYVVGIKPNPPRFQVDQG